MFAPGDIQKRGQERGGYLKYPPLARELGWILNHWGNLVGTDGGYLKNPPRRLYLKNSIVGVGGYFVSCGVVPE